MNIDTIDEIKEMIEYLEGPGYAYGAQIAARHINLLQVLEYKASGLERKEVLIFLKEILAARDEPQDNDDDYQEESTT